MMARSLSGVKIMSGLVFDGFVNTLIRRGYRAGATATAALQRVASGAAADEVPAKSSGIMMKKEGSEEIESVENGVWMPDPVTGCYRPENYAGEIDAVDLRVVLLKPRRSVVN